MALISLGFGAILVSNVLLSQFLGICSFIGVSTQKKNAIGMSFAVIFVLVLASVVTWCIYHFLLIPLGINYLDQIVSILVIATLVQFVEMFLKKFIPKLYEALGIYLPLITTNCAILGVATTNIQNNYSFIEAVVYAVCIGVGYLLVMFIFSSIREKIEVAPVPKYFKGIPVAFVLAGVMALAFYGFGGIF
ncbi:RnfABCDGE type electron transport complex subunit A [bacterium]|jgi:electron transport complex protein RnfA|nr:RnfABCDGE type electron transport complex subunit A [bacterium]